jgi:hypothetical protein
VRTVTEVLERAAAVREAAGRWRAAGWIQAPTEHQIRTEYPDPRVRPSWVWRFLTFVLVTAVLLGLFLALAVGGVRDETSFGILCLFAGGACVAATELQERAPSLARRGGAGASAFWAGTLLVAGAGLLADRIFQLHGDASIEVALAISTAVWGAASVRWGSPVFALFSAGSLVLLLGRQPSGRLLCAAAGLALAALAFRRLDEPSWAPPHRASAAAVLVVALAAVYASVNTWSVETQWLERLRHGDQGTPMAPAILIASAAATAVIPLAVLAWGIRGRRTLLIDAGIVFVALSLVTLRHYVHVAALWAVLAGAGGAALLLALSLERWLARGRGQERSGFTAEPLFSNETRARLLQVIPVATTLSPAVPPPAEKGYVPGGGSFGGGGASDRF